MRQEQILAFAMSCAKRQERVVLASVVRIKGSAPCPVGSVMAVSETGLMEGSVSGGCLETQVVHEAQEVLATGRMRLLSSQGAAKNAFEAGLSCGGHVDVLLQQVGEHLSLSDLERLLHHLRQRDAAVLQSDVTAQKSHVAVAAQDAVTTCQGEHGDIQIVSHVFAPALRLIMIGAVHIAQHLYPIAQSCGFHCVIVDPRSAFATDARFEGVELISDWPDDALQALKIDAKTAIVALSHDPKLDDPGLYAALKSDAFYIGALGSKASHTARCQRLEQLGAADLSRIHGPVGCAISAQGAAEIAVSIMAQVIEVYRK